MELFKTFDKVLSLGYNCNIKSFMCLNGVKQETNLFDDKGTSMWGICELLEDDYSGLSDIENYEKMNIRIKHNILVNKKYYMRFQHEDYLYRCNDDNRNNELFLKMLITLERRAKRFKEHLCNNKKILFIRLEEDNKDRIIYPEYEDKIKRNEYEYVLDFSRFIKKNYENLNYFIIYISRKKDKEYNEENKVITLYNIYDDDSYENLSKIFIDNISFINKYINT